MPRAARKKSSTGIYHIMLRGINRQQIFEDEEAKRVIDKISKCKSAAAFQALETSKRNLYIKKLHKNGLSIRQISRLTGISKKIVEINI